MKPHYGGQCPHCTHPLLQHTSARLKYEACLRCGFAYGTGLRDGDSAAERTNEQWFYVWLLLFKTYGASSRTQLRAKLDEAGVRPRSSDDPAPPPPLTRKTIFNYQLGHLAAVLTAMRCAARHQAPCDACARFTDEPLAPEILADISRGES